MPKTVERTWTEEELEAEYGPRFDKIESRLDAVIESLQEMVNMLSTPKGKRATEEAAS
jgi:hypothetical protein